MPDSPFATGGCRCGAVTVTINDTPKLMAQCHCRDCQKASGTGHFSLAFFAEEKVVIDGETKGFATTTDSGNTATRHFCPECGSRIFGKNTGRPGMTSIPVGCLDDHSWYEPGAVVYAKRREAWDITREDIPNFEEMPPPPPAS